jgi:NAD(P)-dependent dehydrogenase (short-subunit alcohol dehydrogenase family)
MKIQGKTALVTGGASGLGLATVRRLSAGGAAVVAVDLPGAATSALTERGDAVRFVPADVTDEDAVRAAVEAANQNDDLAVVVNCAGIGNAIKTVGKQGPFPLLEFMEIIQVNLIGTFNVIRLAAAAMAGNTRTEEERGCIVNTASVAAFDGQIGQAAYSASKGGIVGMTLPIARDLASLGIRVVTIAPGLFETPLLGSLPEEVRQSLGAQVPIRVASAAPTSTPTSSRRSSATRCSTARRSGSTARSGWRPDERAARTGTGTEGCPYPTLKGSASSPPGRPLPARYRDGSRATRRCRGRRRSGALLRVRPGRARRVRVARSRLGRPRRGPGARC